MRADRHALLQAGRTLLGELADLAALERLSEEELRQAFRRQALRTHPDRARLEGLSAALAEERFKALGQAYELLRAHRRGPSPAAQPAPPRERPAGPPAPASADHYWRGRVPERELRFGEWLYFRGRISWNTLRAALGAQRRSALAASARRRLGQYLLESGTLEPAELERLHACFLDWRWGHTRRRPS